MIPKMHAHRRSPGLVSCDSHTLDTPQMAMIRGLWLGLAQLDGGVADRSEAALGDFVRRQTGQNIGRLNAASASCVIEGLKQWRDRLIAGKE